MSLIIEEESCQPPVIVRPLSIGDVVHDKYEICREIAEGGFGIVFEILDRRNSTKLAMKIELFEINKEERSTLRLEASALKILQGYDHVLRYYDEGRLDAVNYLVMQLSGPSLADLRRCCPEKVFSCGTAMILGLDMLDAIEKVHLAGLLHRDVKPANFAVGLGSDNRTIYILDFGLVRRYLSKKGKIRQARKSAGFRGSIRYASINAHMGLDLGRRDDIWSWLYTFTEFWKGDLPWAFQLSKKVCGETKAKIAKETLLKETPPECVTIYDSIRTLTFAATPPYTMYKNLLMNVVKRLRYSMHSPLDWERGGLYYDAMKNVEPQQSARNDKAVFLFTKNETEEN